MRQLKPERGPIQDEIQGLEKDLPGFKLMELPPEIRRLIFGLIVHAARPFSIGRFQEEKGSLGNVEKRRFVDPGTLPENSERLTRLDGNKKSFCRRVKQIHAGCGSLVHMRCQKIVITLT